MTRVLTTRVHTRKDRQCPLIGALRCLEHPPRHTLMPPTSSDIAQCPSNVHPAVGQRRQDHSGDSVEVGNPNRYQVRLCLVSFVSVTASSTGRGELGGVRVDGNGSHWIDDEVNLMALVADALTDIPAWVANTGRAVYTWQNIDAELARRSH